MRSHVVIDACGCTWADDQAGRNLRPCLSHWLLFAMDERDDLETVATGAGVPSMPGGICSN